MAAICSAHRQSTRAGRALAVVSRFVRPTAALSRINPSLAAQGSSTGQKTSTTAAPNIGLCYPVDITLTLPDGAQYTFFNDFGPHYLPTGLGPDSKVGALVIQGFSQYDEWIVNIGPKIYAYKADTKQLKYIASAYGFELLQAFEYDSTGRLVKISSAGGSSQQFGYTGGRVTSVTDSAQRVWSYGYDANGNLNSVLPRRARQAPGPITMKARRASICSQASAWMDSAPPAMPTTPASASSAVAMNWARASTPSATAPIPPR